jgi:hypothetical protein
VCRSCGAWLGIAANGAFKFKGTTANFGRIISGLLTAEIAKMALPDGRG